MAEFSSAIGTCGLGVGVGVGFAAEGGGGGGGVDFDFVGGGGGGGALAMGFGSVGFVDGEGIGLGCDDRAADLVAIVGWDFDGSVDDLELDCCRKPSTSAGSATDSTFALPAVVVVPFIDSSTSAAFFSSNSFTCSNIFDVVGVVGVGFATKGFSTAFTLGAALFVAVFGAADVPAAFEALFFTVVAFAGVAEAAFTVFVAVLVDFARVVAFFMVSGNSTSTGSEMTFFGLPLFFATSADIVYLELALCKVLSRSNAQRGMLKIVGRFPEDSWTRLGCWSDAVW